MDNRNSKSSSSNRSHPPRNRSGGGPRSRNPRQGSPNRSRQHQSGPIFRNERDVIVVYANNDKHMSEYAGDAVMKFYEGQKSIWIKAMGSAISTAVDVAQLIKERMGLGMVKVNNIKIGSFVPRNSRRGRDQGKKPHDDNSRILSTIQIELVS